MKMPALTLLLTAGLAACVASGETETRSPAEATLNETDSTHPLSPNEALAAFRLDSLFRIEIFAAEPFVRDPVDLVFDEHGRAYAAEMLDYPYEDGRAPASRIRLLKDNDKDGRIDEAVMFADSLQLISGLQPWNGGIIATAAPDILFLKDTDGDGVADERRTLFTGFAEANPQHRVASPRFAVDNWIYVANDGAPGLIHPPGGESVSVLGADFRFRHDPVTDRLEYEPASGPAQFGQAFDAFGRRFITHNTIHVRHVVLPRRYFERNPYLTAAATSHDVSDHGLTVYQMSPPEAWRTARTDTRQQRYDAEGLRRTEHRTGIFTAVAGAAITGNAAFPPPYRGNLFTGETAANLVHRDVLQPDGATFVATRPDQGTEFLTSTDTWFRPGNVVVGPDGYLYVVDMVREIIESPEYIPESIGRGLDFSSGTGYGRIYRILPQDAKTVPHSSIAAEDPADLAAMLADPNPWRRLTAQRLLIERGSADVAPSLATMARRSPAPHARLHALYTLEALGALNQNAVEPALRDPDPGIREHALRFAESFPALAPHVTRLADDASGRVRLQAALSLGSDTSEAADSALVRLAGRSYDDSWIHTAILSAPPERAMPLLEGLLRDERFFQEKTPRKERFLQALTSIVAARGDQADIAHLITRLHEKTALKPWWNAAFSGLADGFELRGLRHLDLPAAVSAFNNMPAEAYETEAVARAARHFLMPESAAKAARIAGDEALPIPRRVEAAKHLVTGRLEQVAPVLQDLLDSEDAALQAAALQAFAGFDHDDIAQTILQQWDRLRPEVRPEAARILATRHAWIVQLLAAVEDGRIDPTVLAMDTRLRLLDHPDDSIRRRAAELVGAEDRTVHPTLERGADADRGRDVFYQECARCHIGGSLGPDLVGVSNKSRELLLEAIVAPSRAVPATYAAYVAELSDGSIVSGRIVREMPGTLTFKNEYGERTVLRAAIPRLRAASHSIMPDDYGRRLSAQDLSDLIAFLQAGAGS